ncbi:MAG: hypothetical protein GX241_06970 [Ruminococcaceae bacterium]|nr:hypothetical protein [Oscillospiraceae bacterium]
MSKSMKNAEYNKLYLFIVIFSYTVPNFIFFLTILTNLPLFTDTITVTQYEQFQAMYSEVSAHVNVLAAILELIALASLFSYHVKKGFPTRLSIMVASINILVCIAFAALIYIIQLRNLHFTFHVIFIVPLISIFLSYIFLFDDYVDILRGIYEKENRVEKAKKKKGELLTAINPNMNDAIISPTEAMRNQQKIISSAAEIAIPDIGETK